MLLGKADEAEWTATGLQGLYAVIHAVPRGLYRALLLWDGVPQITPGSMRAT